MCEEMVILFKKKKKKEKFQNTVSEEQGVILISELGQEQFICSQSFLSYPVTRLANFPLPLLWSTKNGAVL